MLYVAIWYVLLYQMAAMHLYSFILLFSYVCAFFACWAFINLILYGPYIILQYIHNPTR